jgi:transposase-like protein
VSSKVILVDDHAVVRDGIKAIVQRLGKNIEVIGEASSGKDLKEWRSRPLEPIYAMVFMDGLVVKMRVDGSVRKQTIYVIIGVDLEGNKSCLGLYETGRLRSALLDIFDNTSLCILNRSLLIASRNILTIGIGCLI